MPTPTDWPPDTVATGYWLREHGDDAEPVDAGLEGFVAAGAPPVYVGFGSSVGRDPARLGAAISDAVQQAGVRAVVASGWGGLRGVHDDPEVLVIERAPHHWLFPVSPPSSTTEGRGRPRPGCSRHVRPWSAPFQGDQHFWGAAVHRAGVGPPPLPAKKLAGARLASAIRSAIEDSAMHARTAELSERIAREDGATRAAEQLERTLA